MIQQDCEEQDLHELRLRILANMRFSSQEFDIWWDRVSRKLSDDDIKYLIQYLKEQE